MLKYFDEIWSEIGGKYQMFTSMVLVFMLLSLLITLLGKK